MRTPLLGALVCAVVALNGETARAAPPLRVVGPVSTDPAGGRPQIIADRTRLAYLAGAGHVRVIGEDLTEVASVVEPGCAWLAFGGGATLWRCQPADAPPYSDVGATFPIDELDGGPRSVLGPPPLPLGGHGETPVWAGVGRYWMTAHYRAPADTNDYVNRATGMVINANAVESTRARRHIGEITDVDRPDLTRAVCRPLVPKLVDGTYDKVVVAPLAYRAPLGATRSGKRLVMGRCGTRRLGVLSVCPRTCSDPVVGDHFIAWTEGTSRTRRTVYVHMTDCDRTWRWRVGIPAQATDHLLAAVGRRLFVLARWTLQTLRLPAVVTGG